MANVTIETQRRIQELLSEKSAIYRALIELRRRAPEYQFESFLRNRLLDIEGDRSATEQLLQSNDDHLNRYHLMRRLCRELQDSTTAIVHENADGRILDLGMAPGGFSEEALSLYPWAQVSGVTLPIESGGLPLLMEFPPNDRQILYCDLVMLAGEYGVTASDIPEWHPERANFLFNEHAILRTQYDLIFCDARVTFTHRRAEYRQICEDFRLELSQLILAFERVQVGGTIIMRLNDIDAFLTMRIILVIDHCSEMKLFKSSHHAHDSSFYVIAGEMQPHHPIARAAVAEWKEAWRCLTLHIPGFVSCQCPGPSMDDILVAEDLLRQYSERLVALAEPIWQIQYDEMTRELTRSQHP